MFRKYLSILFFSVFFFSFFLNAFGLPQDSYPSPTGNGEFCVSVPDSSPDCRTEDAWDKSDANTKKVDADEAACRARSTTNQPKSWNASRNTCDDAGSCSFTNIAFGSGFFATAGACVGALFAVIINLFLTAILSILENIRYGVGWLTTVIIYFTVVDFKNTFVEFANVSNGGASSNLIYYLWGIIRDIFNTIIFFLVIYHALRSMFDGFDETRPKFIGLLIFSLFINFSLLFVKFAVDLSNIFTLQMYSLSVSPAGSNTWQEFVADNPNNNKPGTIAGFLSKQIDDAKFYDSNGKAQDAKFWSDGFFSLNGALFNFFKIIINLFVIIVLAYICWIFIYRAIIFILAMILSPFITADFFFKQFELRGGSKNILGLIKPFTELIMQRFKDELFKTPILMLFIFLSGVFVTAIFSSPMLSQLSVDAAGVNYLPQSFIFTSVDIVLRFLILCAFAAFGLKILTNTSSWTSGFGGGVFRRGLGGAARIGGIFGQNTVGRITSGNNFVGRNLNRLNNSNWVQNFKNADGGTIVGRGKRLIGSSVVNAIKGVRTGSYDVGNFAGALDKKTGGRLAKSIQGSLAKVEDLNFGKRVTDSFQDRDKAAQGRRQARRDAEIKAAGENVLVTKQYMDLGKTTNPQKLKETGETADAFLADTKNTTTLSAAKMIDPATGDFVNNDQKSKFMRAYLNIDKDASGKPKDNPDHAKALLTLKEARDREQKIAGKIASAEAERRQGEITDQYASGERKAETVLTPVEDILSGRGLGDQRKELKINTAAKSKKDMQDEAKKFPVIAETKRDLDSTLVEIRKTLDFNTLHPGIIDGTQIIKLQDLQNKIIADIALLRIPAGNPSESDRKNTVNIFTHNKDLRGSVIKNKNDVADILASIFDKSQATTINQIEILRNNASDNFKAEEALKPAVIAPRVDHIAYASRVRVAKAQLDSYEDVLKNSFKNSQEIAKNAKKNEEAIKDKFDPKEEVKSIPKP